MGGHGHNHTDAHDAHAFPDDGRDLEAEETLASDEAPTPTWLPLLGISLLIVGITAFVATRPAAPTTEQLLNADKPEAVAEQPGGAAQPSAAPVRPAAPAH